jgi:hypothetical protein
MSGMLNLHKATLGEKSQTLSNNVQKCEILTIGSRHQGNGSTKCQLKIPRLEIPDTSGIETGRIWYFCTEQSSEKNQEPNQTVSKNYKILTIASRPAGQGLCTISARN